MPLRHVNWPKDREDERQFVPVCGDLQSTLQSSRRIGDTPLILKTLVRTCPLMEVSMETQISKPKKSQKSAKSAGSAETAVRQVLESYMAAFRSANINEIMKLYSPDVVAYDLVAPLQFKGKDAYKRSWEKASSMMQGPWYYEPKGLKIYADSDVAYAHCLAEVGGTTKDGKKESGWIRHTLGFCKDNDQWLIAHEQMSVPIEMESGKALMSLKPEETAPH